MINVIENLETEHIYPISRFDNDRIFLKVLYNCRTSSDIIKMREYFLAFFFNN